MFLENFSLFSCKKPLFTRCISGWRKVSDQSNAFEVGWFLCCSCVLTSKCPCCEIVRTGFSCNCIMPEVNIWTSDFQFVSTKIPSWMCNYLSHFRPFCSESRKEFRHKCVQPSEFSNIIKLGTCHRISSGLVNLINYLCFEAKICGVRTC